ncbi:unnamed protein product [Polarella glacialis]|uniref:Cyclic nucleotide-binding domain-containing protein n=1 Tax=Polarella glacialis TaxID=89957 RepID=A0A813HK12_POLGL|nr:unnamed protein product [Polarella glacialis]
MGSGDAELEDVANSTMERGGGEGLRDQPRTGTDMFSLEGRSTPSPWQSSSSTRQELPGQIPRSSPLNLHSQLFKQSLNSHPSVLGQLNRRSRRLGDPEPISPRQRESSFLPRRIGDSDPAIPDMIHSHPLFKGASKDLKDEIAAIAQRVRIRLDEMGGTPAERTALYRGGAGMLSDLFEHNLLPNQSKLLVEQGKEPEDFDGVLIVGLNDAPACEVFFNGHSLGREVDEFTIPGAAGQEVAFGLVKNFMFSVRMHREPAKGTCFIRREDLTCILSKPRFLSEARFIRDQIHRAAVTFISGWLVRHSAKVKIRLFSNMPQDFMSALLRLVSVRMVNAGDCICCESDPGQSAIYLYTGEADVWIRGQKVCMMSQASGFNAWAAWWGMIEAVHACKHRVATVNALTDCVVWELKADDLDKIRPSFPDECGFFEKVAEKQMKQIGPFLLDEIQISILRECSDEFLQVLKKSMTRSQRICYPKENIVTEGDHGDEMFVLVNGSCTVYRSASSTPLRTLHRGACFGEVAVLGISNIRTATITCDTLCDLRVLSRSGLSAVLNLYPQERQRMESITRAYGQSRKTCIDVLLRVGAGFSRAFCSTLAENMFEKPYFAAQPLMQQAEEGQYLFVLVSGEVEIEANGQYVTTVQAPAIFGERVLLEPGCKSSATVRSLVVSNCLLLPTSKDFREVLKAKYPLDFSKLEALVQKKMEITKQTVTDGTGRNSLIKLEDDRTNHFFRDSDFDFMARLGECCERVFFASGTNLTTEGYPCNFLIIQEGKGTATIKGQIVARVGAGDVIGEFVMLGLSENCTASICADQDVLAFSITKATFQELLNDFPRERDRLNDLARKRRGRATILTKVRQVARSTLFGAVAKPADKTSQQEPEKHKSAKPPPVHPRPHSPHPPKNLGGLDVSWVLRRKVEICAGPVVRYQRRELLTPLLPPQGFRVPKAGTGTPWAVVHCHKERGMVRDIPLPSIMRTKKVAGLYGRRIWQACVPDRSCRRSPDLLRPDGLSSSLPEVLSLEEDARALEAKLCESDKRKQEPEQSEKQSRGKLIDEEDLEALEAALKAEMDEQFRLELSSRSLKEQFRDKGETTPLDDGGDVNEPSFEVAANLELQLEQQLEKFGEDVKLETLEEQNEEDEDAVAEEEDEAEAEEEEEKEEKKEEEVDEEEEEEEEVQQQELKKQEEMEEEFERRKSAETVQDVEAAELGDGIMSTEAQATAELAVTRAMASIAKELREELAITRAMVDIPSEEDLKQEENDHVEDMNHSLRGTPPEGM